MIPAWFAEFSPTDPEIQSVLQAGVFLPLRGYDQHGRYALLMRLGQLDPGSMSVDKCWQLIIMMFSLVNEGNVQAQTKGMVVILDLEGMSSSHSSLINPNLIRKLLVVFQEAYPMDNEILLGLSNIYFLNMPKVLEKIVQICISFLNKKYRKILKIQDSSNCTLLEDVGPDILPPEYSGINKRCEELTQFWQTEIVKHQEWFEEQCSFKTIEEERRGGKNKLHHILGCSIM